MDDNAMMMLNAVAIIERFAPRYSQWLERQENMLKRIEQLNNDLLQQLKLGVDCCSVLSPFIDTSAFQSSRIIRNPERKRSVKQEGRNGTNLPRKNEGANKNESPALQTSSGTQKVEPEPPTTSTQSDSKNLNSNKQEQRDLVQPCSGHTRTQCTSSNRGQSKNIERAAAESTAATCDNPPRLLHVPPSMSTRGHNARGSRPPGRGPRGRGRGRGRGYRGNRGRGSFTRIPSVPIHRVDSSDSDGSEIGMFGFTKGEEEELLCQGIKPWDPCAWAAWEVLFDYDY